MNNLAANLGRMTPEKRAYAIEVLVPHLIALRRWHDLARILLELPFLETKVQAGMVFSLAEDYAYAATECPTTNESSQIFHLLEEAIRLNIHFIDQHPDTLFQCLWNACWRDDCPDAACHHEQPYKISSSSRRGQCQSRLRRILQQWRAEKEVDRESFHWVQLLMPLSLTATPPKKILVGHPFGIEAIGVSSDGQRILSASQDGTIIAWNAASGEVITRLETGSDITHAQWSQDYMLIAGAAGNEAIIWNAESGDQVAKLCGHKQDISCLSFSPDGKYLVTGSEDCTLRVWDWEHCRNVQVFDQHTDEITCVAFAPHGKWIASGAYDLTIRLWQPDNGRQLARLCPPNACPAQIVHSPDSSFLAIATTDSDIHIWQLDTGEEVAVRAGHTCWVNCLAYSPNGEWLASGSADNSVRLWHTDHETSGIVLGQQEDEITTLAFSPDGRHLLSGGDDRKIHIYNIPSPDLDNAQLHPGPMDVISVLTASINERRVAAGTLNGDIRVWDVRNGRIIAQCQGHRNGINWLAMTQDGTRVASASVDRTVRFWDAATGAELAQMHGHTKSVNCVAISMDGKTLASASDDGTVRLWDTAGNELSCFAHNAEFATRVAFSPDGDRLLSVTFQGTCMVRELKKDHNAICLQGNKKDGLIGAVAAFASGGRRIVAVADKSIFVWETSTGKLIWHAVQDSEITSFAISDNGDRFAVATENGFANVWDADSLLHIRNVSGTTDIYAIVEGPDRCPWYLIECELESAIISSVTEEIVAVVPVTGIKKLLMFPSYRTWAAVCRGQLIMFRLE